MIRDGFTVTNVESWHSGKGEVTAKRKFWLLAKMLLPRWSSGGGRGSWPKWGHRKLHSTVRGDFHLLNFFSDRSNSFQRAAQVLCPGPWGERILKTVGLSIPLNPMKIPVYYWRYYYYISCNKKCNKQTIRQRITSKVLFKANTCFL